MAEINKAYSLAIEEIMAQVNNQWKILGKQPEIVIISTNLKKLLDKYIGESVHGMKDVKIKSAFGIRLISSPDLDDKEIIVK